MKSILKGKVNLLLTPPTYTPPIDTNTVLKLDNKVSLSEVIFLKIDKYLSEYKTEVLKNKVRNNLGVLSDKETYEIINKIIESIKGEVSVDYDTLQKIEQIIKLEIERNNNHINDLENPHNVTKELIGLENVTNDALVKRSEMGTANGVATLSEQGLVPISQLPSYVDDVIDCYATYDKSDTGILSNIKLYTDIEHLNIIVGEPSKIYVDIEGKYQFRWTGTLFIPVGTPTVIGEITGTAFDGKRGKVLEDKVNEHVANKSNPHEVNANNVLFTTDLIITANVGVHTIDSSGSKTLPTTGKSVKLVMDLLFAEELNPTITQPSVDITLNQAGAKEVGTSIIPTYTAYLNPGKYQFGPETGVTVSSWNITDTNGGSKDTTTGSFDEFQVIDSTNYKITAQAQHTDGVIPVTNLGNNYDAGKIKASSKSKVSSTITGYRNSFYGTFTNKNELTSAVIRTLTKSNRALANSATFNITIPVGALRVVIAYPATLRTLTSVLDVNGLNAEIVTGFKESRLNVEGLNGYQAIEYRVYTLDYANPNDKGNTYKVTI